MLVGIVQGRKGERINNRHTDKEEQRGLVGERGSARQSKMER
jgi:hypothetical protein